MSKKIKGPIRTEAVVPFFIIMVITYCYFHFLFDLHLKKAIEFGGYQALGVELNIEQIKTSFFDGSFQLKKLELTDSENPQHNAVEIGEIRFSIPWNGLLRARLIIDEIAVEQIGINTLRKTKGKVKPPEPPKADDGQTSKVINEAKDKALQTIENKNKENAIGDIAAFLSQSNNQDQLGKIQDNLESKKKIDALNITIKDKQKKWDDKLKSLPNQQEIQGINDRISKLKTKDFKSPQELQQTLSEADKIVKEIDEKFKKVQGADGEFNEDIKFLDTQLKEIDQSIKSDIKNLEQRLHLPKLDAKSITESILRSYLNPYINKANYYRGLAEKYLPPKLLKKDNTSTDDETIQPHPRSKGISYEFGHNNSLPMFWLKKILISSKSTTNNSNYGNIKGGITDITSNQKLTKKPTVMNIQGDFPAQKISNLETMFSLDNTQNESKIHYDFKIGSYAIDSKDLLQSEDASISFTNANASINSQGNLIGLKQLNLQSKNIIQNAKYEISAKEPILKEILISVFNGLPNLNIEANAAGELPQNVKLDLSSNFGPELQKGFEKQIQKKIDEARAKLQKSINDEVGKNRAEIEKQLNNLKSQVDSQLQKIKDQINKEKKQNEDKVTSAKKDAENQVKKSITPDVEKKIDDLKKKFGL